MLVSGNLYLRLSLIRALTWPLRLLSTAALLIVVACSKHNQKLENVHDIERSVHQVVSQGGSVAIISKRLQEIGFGPVFTPHDIGMKQQGIFLAAREINKTVFSVETVVVELKAPSLNDIPDQVNVTANRSSL